MISLGRQKRTKRSRGANPSLQPANVSGSRRHPRTNPRSTRLLKRDLAIVAVIGALALMAHVYEFANIASLGYERAHLRSEERRISRENSNLRAQLEILESPQRIDGMAASRNMVQRSEADFIALAPAPELPAKPRPMLAGFLPEWLTKRITGKR